MAAAHHGDFALFRRLLREVRPYWSRLAIVGALEACKAPLLLLLPLPLKIVVDSVLGSQPLPGFLEALWPSGSRSGRETLALAIGLLLGIALLEKVRGLASWVLGAQVNGRLALDFRAKLFHHAQGLSLAYHDTRGTADSLYRISRDAGAIQQVASGITPYVVALLTLAGMLLVTLRIDVQLSLVALGAAPVVLFLVLSQRTRIRRTWNDSFEHESRALAVVQEVLAALRLVKAFGREETEKDRYVRHAHKAVRSQVRAATIEGVLGVGVTAAFTLSTAAALLLGVAHIQQGRLTLGELLLVMAYIGQLYGPLELLSRFTSDFQSTFAGAARALAILDEEPDVVDAPNARPLARARGAIELRNVSFTYGSDRPALHRVSFEVPPGARVGISGPTGAGKTTLVSLISRFHDPTEGQVFLDGVDVREYKVADLRNQFAVVLQEPVLFSTSIAENIAYGRPDATEDAIVAAARAANVDAFIRALPQGYATPVGERGVQLSGGERQRIALARAFLKDVPLLILDEPTSAVDTATEAAIMESLERLMEGRTTFMIAHRLSTLEACDWRLELDHGRLASLAPVRARLGVSVDPRRSSAS